MSRQIKTMFLALITGLFISSAIVKHLNKESKPMSDPVKLEYINSLIVEHEATRYTLDSFKIVVTNRIKLKESYE